MRDRLAPAPVQSADRSGLGTQTSPATAVKVPREAGVADNADLGTSTSGDKASSGKQTTASRARAGSTAAGRLNLSRPRSGRGSGSPGRCGDLRAAATPRPRSCQDAARIVVLTITSPRSVHPGP